MHQHQVYDTDNHFVIDPITKEIINQSEKMKLMLGDHNSERFTFEIPRYIDGHDMTLCNKIEIHYINIDAKTKESKKDVYIVNDMQLSPNGEDVVIFSWLISGNATRLAGTLNFRATFKCISEPSIIDYQMSTEIFKGITVSDGISNSESVIEEYSDVLEQWKQELNLAGEYAQQIQQNASKIDKLQAGLSESRDYVNEIINYEIKWNDGGYISKDDGSVKSETGSSYSDFVAVIPGTKLIITNTMTENTEWNAFYDANKTFLSPFSNATGEVIVPNGAVKMRLSKYSTATITIASNIKSYIDDSIENVEAKAKSTDDAVAELKGDLSNLKPIEYDEIIESPDFNNESELTFIDNKRLASNGTIIDSKTYAVTDFIDISDVSLIYRYGTTMKYNLRAYCLYDSDKKMIKFFVRTTDYEFENVNGHTDATVYNLTDDNGVKAKYIRIEKEMAIDNYHFISVPIKEEYILNNEIKFPSYANMMKKLEGIEKVNAHILEGKTIVCFGDSIFGNNDSDTGVCKQIAKNTKATVINVAFGGTRMTNRGTETTGYDKFDFPTLSASVVSKDWSGQENALTTYSMPSYYASRLETLKNIDFSDVDIITFNYGTNDYTGYGDIREEYKTEMINCISRLQSAYQHIKFIAISPTWRLWYESDGIYLEDSDTKVFGTNVTLPTICELMKTICKEDLHIPFIDCYNIGINKNNFSYYLNSTDGTHHDTNGRIALAEHISRQIVTL